MKFLLFLQGKKQKQCKQKAIMLLKFFKEYLFLLHVKSKIR